MYQNKKRLKLVLPTLQEKKGLYLGSSRFIWTDNVSSQKTRLTYVTT